ncbi:MAG: flagellar basal body protein, partial [Pseudomonadota bacterium]
MSLTNTLSNALTGLNAASRQADLIANNLANALTEGYGRREIELGSVQVGDRGAGVGINGVTRISDPRATGVRRLAEADSAASGTLADAQQRLADALGLPGEPDSLASRADTLDAALAAAAETPENGPLLSGAVTAAEDLARSFRDAASEARAIRQDADRDIARQVETLNASLTEIESLNAEIRNATQRGTETAALEDRRHVLIDRISGIVPLKVVQRDLGQVALFGKNGGQLLDGRAFPFEFTGTPIITPEMTLADGNLSGLTVNGAEQEVGTGRGFFDGGSLEASFAVRDRLVPEASARLDALAADLLQRVAQPSTDPSLGLVEPGLFTDAGAALDPTNIQGLSARIVIN